MDAPQDGQPGTYVSTGTLPPAEQMQTLVDEAYERYRTGDHEVHILESKPYRLQRTLSDLNGIDPKIHFRKPARAIHAVLAITRHPQGNPTTARAMKLYERVWRHLVPRLKAEFSDDLFEREIYEELCVGIRLEAMLAELV